MVVAPSPEEEDRRRLCRERRTLIEERITHVNRIKGLLFAQGVSDYAPLRRDRRGRPGGVCPRRGRGLLTEFKGALRREDYWTEVLLEQIPHRQAPPLTLL